MKSRILSISVFTAVVACAGCQVQSAAASATSFATDSAAEIAVVRAHLDAENAHDIDAILRTLADTVQYSVSAAGGRDSLIVADRAKQRAMYQSAVSHVPDSRFEILDYFVSGHLVATRERMTATRSGWSDVGASAYWVDGGVIHHLWLLSSGENTP